MNYGCDYCTEDRSGYTRMFGAFYVMQDMFSDKWFIKTGHCKPREIHFCPMCGRKLPKGGGT